MKEIILKTNERLIIREAKAEDADLAIQYVKRVGDESDFLTFSGDEFNKTVDDERKLFAAHHNAPNQIFLLAFINGKLAGMLNVQASQRRRLRHIGEFGVSVLKEHWYKGVGSALLQYMIDWAQNNELIRKVNLKVSANNHHAIKLYEKYGFKKEGTLERDMYLDGVFSDCHCMGLKID